MLKVNKKAVKKLFQDMATMSESRRFRIYHIPDGKEIIPEGVSCTGARGDFVNLPKGSVILKYVRMCGGKSVIVYNPKFRKVKVNETIPWGRVLPVRP
jgi:hypothetical protein